MRAGEEAEAETVAVAKRATRAKEVGIRSRGVGGDKNSTFTARGGHCATTKDITAMRAKGDFTSNVHNWLVGNWRGARGFPCLWVVTIVLSSLLATLALAVASCSGDYARTCPQET